MKIEELFENSAKGTYAAVKFDDKTVKNIEKYIKDNNIPNPVPSSKLHTTLLYSRKPCPDFVPLGKLEETLVGTPTNFDIWKSSGDEPMYCLVLKYRCRDLVKRHKALMKEHHATYDFPEYIPHITLSYDVGEEFDKDALSNIVEAIPTLIINEEYSEDLDEEWKKSL